MRITDRRDLVTDHGGVTGCSGVVRVPGGYVIGMTGSVGVMTESELPERGRRNQRCGAGQQAATRDS
jgi:hypothetical protein